MTQHLLGAVVFETVDLAGESVMTGDWQIQAQHRRTLSNGESVEFTGHSYVRHYYARDESGVWKLRGVQPHDIVIKHGHPGLVVGDFPE